jgi:hypothetical protein
MAGWRFVIADLNGVTFGEPRAFDRRLAFGVSQAATGSFRIRATDTMWPLIAAGSTMVKCYDTGGNLRAYGPVVGDALTAQGQGGMTQVAFADLTWRLGKRFVGKDAAGIGVAYAAQDAGVIAYNVLSLVNADAATGIIAGTANACVTQTVTYTYKRALDALSELGASAGSYEWLLRYVDGAAGAIPTVYLDLPTAAGTDRRTSVFLEYGTGKLNVKTIVRSRSIDQLATDMWVLGGGSGVNSHSYDTTARATYGLHEDVLSVGDITTQSLLDALAAAHVAVRKQPRTVWSLTPFVKTAPKYGVDYHLGDTVTTRATVAGTNVLNGVCRLWGVQLDIDDLGNEQATLQLTPTA